MRKKQKTSRQRTQLPKLSETEWTVMKAFWDEGDLAARDVYAVLPPHHGWAYKTVKTMLSRLVKKGALEYSQVGNSYLYRHRIQREEMVRQAVRTFSDRVLGGAFEPFLVNFFEGRRPSEEEIAAMRELLDEVDVDDSSRDSKEGCTHDV